MNLILLEPSEVGDSGDVVLSGPRATHVIEVLKATPGKGIRIGVVNGPCGIGTVQTVSGDEVSLRCVFKSAAPPRPSVDLLLALPRPKVMRRLWAQLAALGVGRIIVTNAERVERNYFDAQALDPACYRPLLIEGLQQARDTQLPEVSIHRRFRPLVEDELGSLSDATLRLVADPRASATIGDVAAASSEQRCLLAVGPEGGWNEFETDMLVAHGFQAVGMGARTLRTDTACIALLALIGMNRHRHAPPASQEMERP